MVLPSSQVSLPLRMLSPQMGEHQVPIIGQCQPTSMVRQSDEQPSPETVLPSSQVSSEVKLPFPQTGMFTHPADVHGPQPSNLQRDEHPSPDFVFPSSHSSPRSSIPSPHAGLATSALTIGRSIATAGGSVATSKDGAVPASAARGRIGSAAHAESESSPSQILENPRATMCMTYLCLRPVKAYPRVRLLDQRRVARA